MRWPATAAARAVHIHVLGVLCVVLLWQGASSRLSAATRASMAIPTRKSRKFIKGYTTDPGAAGADYVANFNKAFDGKGGHKADGTPYFSPKSDKACCHVCPTRFYKQLSFLELPPEVHAAAETNFWTWFAQLGADGRAKRAPRPPPGASAPKLDAAVAAAFVQAAERRSGAAAGHNSHGMGGPPNVYENAKTGHQLSHNNKFEKRSPLTGGGQTAVTTRPKPVSKSLDGIAGLRKQYACPQNYGSSAFFGDSACCNICPDDTDYFYPFRDFSTYVPRIFGAYQSKEMDAYMEKNRQNDPGSKDCPWEPEPYVPGLLSSKCCRLCAASFVPYYKKPHFDDDPVASQRVFAPRADPSGRTLPDIYSGSIVFLQEGTTAGGDTTGDGDGAADDAPAADVAATHKGAAQAAAAATAAAAARVATRLAFVDDADDPRGFGRSAFRKRRSSLPGVGPPPPLSVVGDFDGGDDGSNLPMRPPGAGSDNRASTTHSSRTATATVEVDATRPADVDTFDALIEMEASGIFGDDQCCIVCPSDMYMSAEGGSLEDKPFSEPTSEQERADEMLKPLGITPRRVGNARKYTSVLHPTKFGTFTEGTAGAEPNFNGFSEHQIALP